ncbi:MAG: hypothetical protein PVG14_01915 [Anaerolineales bacterium]|jgi:hypothetical protein
MLAGRWYLGVGLILRELPAAFGLGFMVAGYELWTRHAARKAGG